MGPKDGEVLKNIREAKEFVRQNKQKHDSVRHKRQQLMEMCNTVVQIPQQTIPCIRKMLSGSGKTNLFQTVYRLIQRQRQGQGLPKSSRSVHKV